MRACSMASSAPSPHLPTGEKRRGEHLLARLQHGLERAVAASYADDRAVTCGWAPGEHLHAHPMRTTSRWRAEGRGRRGEHLHAHPMLTTSRCRASKTLASTSACVGVGHAHVPKGGGGGGARAVVGTCMRAEPAMRTYRLRATWRQFRQALGGAAVGRCGRWTATVAAAVAAVAAAAEAMAVAEAVAATAIAAAEAMATLVATQARAQHGALTCPVSRGPRSAMAQTDVPRTARPRAASRARRMHARSCC